MSVLVTGGAGFIGSAYVRHLLAHTDERIVIFDALTYAGHESTIADVRSDDRVTFVVGDVCDRDAVSTAMAGCRSVVHFAAESHVDRSILGPDAFVRTNCDGTNVVCDVARELGVARVVHVSTDEVYGSISAGSATEEWPLRPSSPYSASKAGSDLIALSYHLTFGLDVVVTRSSNNYGPFQLPEKVIPLFITNLLAGLKVPLYGDGGNVRDWLHVDDNCAAIEAVRQQGSAGAVYNVGGGNEVTNLELTRQLVALCGRDEALIEPVVDRLGHDRRYSVDCSKVRALGWKPLIELSDGLEATVEWYRSHAWWWEPIKDQLASLR